MDGHNGKRSDTNIKIGTQCGLQVIRRQMTAKKMRVTVGGLRGRGGSVRISGMSIKSESVSFKRAQSVVLETKLTEYGKTQRRLGRRVPVKVTFTPNSGKAQSIKFPAKKKKR